MAKWTIAEYARENRVSERTVRRQIKSGKIEATLVDGKYIIETAQEAPEAKTSGVDNAYTELLARFVSLQQENRDLALSLGQARQQILQLSSPWRPWWRRLFR